MSEPAAPMPQQDGMPPIPQGANRIFRIQGQISPAELHLLSEAYSTVEKAMHHRNTLLTGLKAFYGMEPSAEIDLMNGTFGVMEDVVIAEEGPKREASPAPAAVQAGRDRGRKGGKRR